MPKKIIEDIAYKISQSLPEGIKHTQKEMERTVKILLEQSLHKMNIVTKEEFEATHKILLKSREKIEVLEKRLSQLEAQMNKTNH